MSEEILAILEQIEREKGIKKEVLIEAVESALVSAARKVMNLKPDEELKVELDRSNGKIKATCSGRVVTSIDFGRIAAQTAKQVIIQKIREAEKDVIFTEFNSKVGTIVSGTVYRFEKGNIIIDLLGRAEGILSRREQSPREEFRQGERIRAYLLEVRKESRGPQIILSRAHPNFVKKLFELEVPEIYEGIVEIRGISRQPGERTKITVYSKEERVDSVGACVGMRGNRVKNIVNELRGEKIDIVRFNDNIKEYITTALAPAKIAEINLNRDNLRAEVIVEDDQLSLAIGKHGQNVRLASRLVGWELDIRTKETKVQEAKEAKAKEAKAEAPSLKPKARAKVKKGMPLAEISGIGDKLLDSLKESGFKTVEDLVDVDLDKLLEVKGIGKVKAKKLIQEAKKLTSVKSTSLSK
ncbi:MAG: transcription termination factor NusA [Candidatus Omnitrophica bacterium]|nr:transcription termination factor NusA [Candidatus Omnitrophota bacterium]